MSGYASSGCRPAASGRRVRPDAAGFSLTESLIAITLFGIGFLALAALQVAGIRSTTESHQRSLAQLMVQEMADRIRANRLLVLSTDRTAYTATDPDAIDAGTVTLCHSSGVTSCNSSEIATYDLLQWRLNYRALLPGADGLVCYDDTPVVASLAEFNACDGGDILTVRLRWTVRGSTAAETAEHYVVAPLLAL